MPRLQLPCPTCGRPLELQDATDLGNGEILELFKCGHAFVKTYNPSDPHDLQIDFASLDGKKHAYGYQEAGVRFLLGVGEFEEAGRIRGTSAILADQQRIGKTPQGLMALRHKFKEAQRLEPEGPPKKALVLARAANLYQWKREVNTWIDNKPNAVWMIQGTKNWIPDGFKVYICSMDTFARRGSCGNCEHQFHDDECTKKGCGCRISRPNGDAMSDVLLNFGFSQVIVDEAHHFKNSDSNRTQALTAFLKNIERCETVQEIPFTCMFCKHQWAETVTIQTSTQEATKRIGKTSHCPECFAKQSQSAAVHVKVTRNCSVWFLSGTPIKNRADEAFVPLNIIAPERVPSLTSFRRSFLTQNSKGAWSRVAPGRMDAWKEMLNPYLLRREKEDVYTDLPPMNRIFTPIEISDERLKKAYNRVLDEIEVNLSQTGKAQYFRDIGHLQQLRQICGLAKVQWAADYAETFVMDSETQKIAIGVHHHSVRDELKQQLEHLGVVTLDGTTSAFEKDRIAHRYFEKSPEQILLLGMMAAKEGLELVYIDTALVLEREWSAAEEEQFEYRFFNPNKEYLKSRGLENKSTTIEYILAQKTIDWFFYEMVEEKRLIFGETLGTNFSLESDTDSFSTLIERTLASRL